MPNITIVMPVYNVEHYLERAVKSIINQKYSHWELIMVNDGSTDKSGEICNQLAVIDNRIKVIHQKNTGSGKARQAALNISSGTYICFVDPDDYLDGNAFYNNARIIESFKPDIIVNGYYEIKRVNNNKSHTKKYTPQLEGLYNQEEFRRFFSQYELVGGRALWNKLYKKKFITENNIKFSEQRIGQDALFNYEAYKFVESIYVDKKEYYYYDNTRINSTVKIYQSDRVTYEMNIAKSYSDLFGYWNKKSEFHQNIYESYWNVLLSELINLNKRKCPLSFREKDKKIKKLATDTNISVALRELSTTDARTFFLKLCLFLSKKKLYKPAILLVKIYTTIRLGS